MSADEPHPHPYYILTTKYSYGNQDDKCLVVNISSVPTDPNVYYDSTCILNASHGGFIKHDSYVLYSEAQLLNEKDLVAKINSDTVLYYDKFHSNTYTLICNGFKMSQNSDPDYVDFLIGFLKTPQPKI